MENELIEPLEFVEARRLIREMLQNGTFRFTGHAEQRMRDHNLIAPDCTNVLEAGVVESVDFERGTWRYRVGTVRICVVVAFRSPTNMAIVTAWRK